MSIWTCLTTCSIVKVKSKRRVMEVISESDDSSNETLQDAAMTV